VFAVIFGVALVVDLGGDREEVVLESEEVVSGGRVGVHAPPSVRDRVLVVPGDDDYAADSGGEYEVTLTLQTEDGPVSATDTVEFDGTDYRIFDVDTVFFDEYDSSNSELSSVSFSVENEGDISLRYDSIEFEIDGTSQTDNPYGTRAVEPGSSRIEYLSTSDDVVVDQGSHELTIRLIRDGDTVASETTIVTAE